MSRQEILDQVVQICKDVFDNDELELTEESSAADVEEWDSLTHLNLMSDIEEEFGITFKLEEITAAKNIGELVSIIVAHLEK